MLLITHHLVCTMYILTVDHMNQKHDHKLRLFVSSWNTQQLIWFSTEKISSSEKWIIIINQKQKSYRSKTQEYGLWLGGLTIVLLSKFIVSEYKEKYQCIKNGLRLRRLFEMRRDGPRAVLCKKYFQNRCESRPFIL